VSLAEKLDRSIISEFEPLLAAAGFKRVADRKWIRSLKLPIREIFVVKALKGATYCPAWGFSSGLIPAVTSGKFKRQSTDKNAVMDLIIDPVDLSGEVPPEAFDLVQTWFRSVPTKAIRACAGYFVPLALLDFDRVMSIDGLAALAEERSQLTYRRFGCENYDQHCLLRSFLSIRAGEVEKGKSALRSFCQARELDENDAVLRDYLHKMLSPRAE
jgi:hypothetical protein